MKSFFGRHVVELYIPVVLLIALGLLAIVSVFTSQSSVVRFGLALSVATLGVRVFSGGYSSISMRAITRLTRKKSLMPLSGQQRALEDRDRTWDALLQLFLEDPDQNGLRDKIAMFEDVYHVPKAMGHNLKSTSKRLAMIRVWIEMQGESGSTPAPPTNLAQALSQGMSWLEWAAKFLPEEVRQDAFDTARDRLYDGASSLRSGSEIRDLAMNLGWNMILSAGQQRFGRVPTWREKHSALAIAVGALSTIGSVIGIVTLPLVLIGHVSALLILAILLAMVLAGVVGGCSVVYTERRRQP